MPGLPGDAVEGVAVTPGSSLSKEVVERIRALRATRKTIRDIHRATGVATATIQRYLDPDYKVNWYELMRKYQKSPKGIAARKRAQKRYHQRKREG